MFVLFFENFFYPVFPPCCPLYFVINIMLNVILFGHNTKIIKSAKILITIITDIIFVIIALFDMPNSNRFDILSISIFSKISLPISIFFRMALSISILIFFKFADISTIDINIRYSINETGEKTPK